MFSVSHQGISFSTGSFVDFSGRFELDEDNIEKSSVSVTIQTASINLNDPRWNVDMRGESWFNSSTHPTMTFVSTRVKETGDNTMDVRGNLTLLGTTKPVTLKVRMNKVGDMMGQATAGFSATATIDRTEFGMATYAPMIGADVDIRIEVEGKKL
jgi:polyisoprenoid-binding protein YceI